MLRVALFGAGRWGKNYLKAVDDTGYGYVSHVFTSTTNSNRIEEFRGSSAKDIRIRCQSPLVDSIESESFDVAIVATNPPSTEALTLRLLESGVSVMAEKPFALHLNALSKVDALLENKRNQAVFLIDHQHLFSNAIHFIRSLIKNDLVLSYKANAGGLGPYRSYPPIWDYGPHDLAILHLLTSEKLNLYKSTTIKDTSGISQQLNLESKDQLAASISCWNNKLPKTHIVQIETRRHRITYDDFNPMGKLSVDGEFIPLEQRQPLTLAVESFLRRVQNLESASDVRFGTQIASSYTRLLVEMSSADEINA